MAWSTKQKEKDYWKKVKHKYHKRFYKKYHSDNDFRQLVLARGKAWRSSNPEKVLEINRKANQRHLRLRFSVLKRDKFSCVYCGRTAKEAKLEIDHIHPQSKGGLSKIENYATACKECNVGKADTLL